MSCDYKRVKLNVTEKERITLDVGDVAIAKGSDAALPNWGDGLVFDRKTNTLSTDLQRAELEALLASKQNLLIEGDNITLTENLDGTITISSSGSAPPDVVAVPMTEIQSWFM